MNDKDRIDALTRMLIDVVDALLRQGTEQDGNWGHMSTRETLQSIQRDLEALRDAALDGDKR